MRTQRAVFLYAHPVRTIFGHNDETHVRTHFSDCPWIDLRIVDATDRFLKALAGIEDMPEKRLAMKGVYDAVLDVQATHFEADFVADGTLFTDISESDGGYESGSDKARIKGHHNVDSVLSVPKLTPLDDCVKDGGRNIGRTVGVPEELLQRHPFPGPGLIVRIEGAITAERLRIARQLDGIYIEELRRWDVYDSVWQAGAVVTRTETTCTKGDDAGTGIIVLLWAGLERQRVHCALGRPAVRLPASCVYPHHE